MKPRPLINRLLSYFVRGLLFVAPIGFTVLILMSAFDFVDNIIRIRMPNAAPDSENFIPGLGFLIIVSCTMLIGFVISVFLPQALQNLVENIIRHIPLVRIFYFAFKDLISAFVGDKRKFNQPVLMLLNREAGIQKVGFITQNDLSNLGLKDKIAVYCPHSYAFSGELYIVPKENIQPLDLPSADVMKLIVSGGVSIDG